MQSRATIHHSIGSHESIAVGHLCRPARSLFEVAAQFPAWPEIAPRLSCVRPAPGRGVVAARGPARVDSRRAGGPVKVRPPRPSDGRRSTPFSRSGHSGVEAAGGCSGVASDVARMGSVVMSGATDLAGRCGWRVVMPASCAAARLPTICVTKRLLEIPATANREQYLLA